MKNYDETISAVFERMDEFEKIKMRKRKLAIKTLIPLTCLCLATIIGISVWQNANAKPTNTSSSSKTSSQNKKVIYVTADSPDDYSDDSSSLMSLRKKYISPALQEKMDLYKDYKEAEVVFRVTVQLFAAGEDYEEADKIVDADKEVQSLYEQYLAAREEEDKAEAEYYAFCEANPGNEPEIIAERHRMVLIIESKEKIRGNLHSKWDDLRREIIDEYIQDVKSKRLEFAAQFSEKEPTLVVTDSYCYYRAYNMDLTAEEIYILAEKGGYVFRFSTNDYIPGEENA